MMTPLDFTVLGIPVRLESDDPGLPDLVRGLWGSAPPSTGDSPLRYALRSGPGGARLEGPDGVRDLDSRRPALHAYNLVLSSVLGRIDDAFVFHAGALAREGRALLVSGPSTFGKTTLSVGLALEGFGFLGDDLTAIDRRTGRVHAASRAVRLRPGSRPLLPRAALERARACRTVEADGTWVVDPQVWLGRSEQADGIAVVAILRSREDQGRTRRFPRLQIEFVSGAEGRIRELPGVSGVSKVDEDASRPGAAIVTMARAGALDAWLRANGDAILASVKLVAGPPDFEGEPALEPIGPFQAALELCQEMVNRHAGSRLDAEFRGREPQLVTDTARLLAGARCYALHTGGLQRSVGILSAAFDEAVGGR